MSKQNIKYLRLNAILEDIVDSEIIQYERMRFNGGENHIILKSPVSSEVIIEAKLINSDYVVELLMATDALRRAGAKKIYLLAPYIPYGRQDRIMVDGEPLSIKVFAGLLNTQKYETVYTLDNHSSVTTALIDNCREINNKRIINRVIKDYSPCYLISPDAGAYKKISMIAKACDLKLIQATKERDVTSGKITGTEVHAENLCGESCLIIDDICDGGRTFIELAKALRLKNAGKVILYVAHGIFPYGIDSINEVIDEIITTNCFRLECDTKYWKNLTVIKLRKEDLK